MTYGLSKICAKLLNIPKVSTPSIIMAIWLGYPNAAKFIYELYTKKLISSSDVEHLLAITSLANPTYIISTIGLSFYSNLSLGIILLVSHLLSNFLLAMLFRFKYKNIIQQKLNFSYIKPQKTFGFEVISNSVLNSVKTLMFIFSFMTIFSCISEIICATLNTNDISSAVICAIFEITNGIQKISILNLSFNSKILLTSFCLSFGSFMILYQIYTVVYKTKISFMRFVKHKLCHGILSALTTYAILKTVNLIDITLPAFSNIEYNKEIAFNPLIFTTLISLFLVFLSFLIKKSVKRDWPI